MKSLAIKRIRFLRFAPLLFLFTGAETLTFAGQDPQRQSELEPAPTAPAGPSQAWLSKVSTDETGGYALSVNPSNRDESSNFYRSQYLMASSPDVSWTGNLSTCNPGTTSAAFRNKVFQRINYFRAMAGVPAVAPDPDYCSKAQAAALIMAVNSISHYPSPNWPCYSPEGAEAAARANLSGGLMGWEAITGYMGDWGGGNHAVGHRRWLLYPQTQLMGTGDIPSSGYYGTYGINALWVMDGNAWGARPATREPYVAWPPPGYVPYPLVFDRWSFSHPGADFSSASVSMSRGGVGVPVTLEPVVSGYGEPTLVWIPTGVASGSAPASDITYNISVRNVLINGSARSFDYQVTVFDAGQQPLAEETPPSRTLNEGEVRSRYQRRLR